MSTFLSVWFRKSEVISLQSSINKIVKVISSFVYKATNQKLKKISLSEGIENSLMQSKINYDPRKPYFCAGCPHNSSTIIPEGSRAYAGFGCHYMVQWMDRSTVGYTHMGGEGANWIGEAQFSRRDHIFQNIGDGTYNHSGLQAIRAAIAARVNITYKILFNDEHYSKLQSKLKTSCRRFWYCTVLHSTLANSHGGPAPTSYQQRLLHSGRYSF